MTGEDEISIRGCELGKLGWLVVDYDYRARSIERSDQLCGSLADDAAFLAAGGIEPSDQVKGIANEHHLIL